MILHVASNAPLLIRAGAVTLLAIHIGGAVGGMGAGAVAMAARKGGRVHRAAGKVFFVSMLAMSIIGAVVAPFLPQRISAVAGGLAFYLVISGWAAGRRRDRETGRTEVAVFAVGLAVVIAGLAMAGLALSNPDHRLDHLPWQAPLVFAAVASLGSAFDLKVIFRHGLERRQRIARHLWRMGMALTFTALSFAGQPKAYPASLRGSPILLIPMLAAFGLTLWWLWRTRFAGQRRPSPRTRLTATAVET